MAIKPKQQQQAAAVTAGVGLNPKEESLWTSGGGLFDDFDGTILEMAFTSWDYQGHVDPPVLALAVEIRNDEEESSTEGAMNPFIQYFSAGDMTQFVPSDDGKEAIPVGSKTGLSRSTNAFAFLMSMVGAGFDPSLIGKRVDVFEGARFHFKREKQPERKGIAKKEGQRDREILKAEKLIAMPGQAGSTPAPGAATGAGAGPTKPAVGPTNKPTPTPGNRSVPGPQVGPTNKPQTTGQIAPAQAAPTNGSGSVNIPDEIQTWAGIYIVTKISDAGGSHPKVGLAKDVLTWAKEQGLDIPTRNKVIQALGNEAFLSSDGLGWTFDGQTLTLAD